MSVVLDRDGGDLARTHRLGLARLETAVRREVIDAVYSSADYVHPLLNDPRDTPSGKLWHAFQVMSPWEFYDPFGLEDDLWNSDKLSTVVFIAVALASWAGSSWAIWRLLTASRPAS